MENRSVPSGAEERELLSRLVQQGKQRLFWARLTGILCAVIVVAMALAALILAPRFQGILEKIETTAVQVNELAQEAYTLVNNANVLVEDNTAAVSEAIDTMNSAVKKINEMDFNNLNSVIRQLNTTVGKVNQLDLSPLNDAIKNLGDTVSSLSKLLNPFQN